MSGIPKYYPHIIVINMSNYWTPEKIAYLYFYILHSITHENIAKLLAVEAPRGSLGPRRPNGVRSKARTLRQQFGLDSGGKADPEKVRLQLKIHLFIHNLSCPDADRDPFQEEQDIIALVHTIPLNVIHIG